MATVISDTSCFGEQKGINFMSVDFFNDTVDVGGLPSEQTIKGIKQIKVMQGHIVDGIQVTYQMTDGSTKAGPVRGGEARIPSTGTVDFGTNEILIGVTGKLGIPGDSRFTNSLCALRFVIADTATGTMRVAGPFGYGAGADKYTSKSFTIVGPIIAFGGKSFTKGKDPLNCVTLSFIKSVSVDSNNGLVPV